MTDEQLQIPDPDDEPGLGPESAAEPETVSEDYDPETGYGVPF